jgi:hypothetical protein
VKTILLGCLLLIVSVSASADISVRDYEETKAKGGELWETMKIYIGGFGNGFTYANVGIAAKHQKPLICPPEQLGIYKENYVNMLDEAIRALRPSDDTSIDDVLMLGIERTFPCKK